ncbi:MAG: hypothetical protein KDD38_07025 [Bdellovibrionales bacterium]|nr:hypothetical protein [Bdellovibrionales bacterium]
MKTLTLNHKRILFGMLVVTLGFSKSWLLGASEVTRVDLASETAASGPVAPPTRVRTSATSSSQRIKRQVEVNGKDYIIDVTLTKKQMEVMDVVDGNVTTKFDTVTVATFSDNGCTTCISSMQLTNITDVADLSSQLDNHIKKEKEAQLKKEKEKKKLDEAVANCEKAVDSDGEVIDLLDDKNSKKYWSCKATKVKEDNDDRTERRQAFHTEIVDELQQRLLEASPEEYAGILADIKEIKRTVGYDSALRSELTFLEKGANAMVSLPGLGAQLAQLKNQYARNPNDPSLYAIDQNCAALGKRLNKRMTKIDCAMNNIDQISWDFNPQKVPNLQSSSSAYATMTDWHNIIAPRTMETIKNPDQVARGFFNSALSDSSIMPNTSSTFDNQANGNSTGNNQNNGQNSNNSYGNDGTRSQRVPTGMQYVPQYLNTNQQGNFNNQQGNNNNSRYSSNVYPPQQNYNQQNYGNQYNQSYNNNTYSSYPSQNQYAPGYNRGGIPQAGRYR